MWDIILWIVLGALAGWIASMIMRTNAEQGALANIIIGILGALIGGSLMQMLTGNNTAEGFNFTTLLTAVLGAVILLAIIKAFRRSSAHKV